jgi:hypothetical protein
MKNTYYLSLYALASAVFLNEFFAMPEHVFTTVVVGSLALFLISALSLTRGFQLYVSLIALLVGHGIIFSYQLDFNIWYSSLTKAVGIPVLFTAIPLISFPIKHGPYLESIESHLYARRHRTGLLFALLTLMHLALSVVLNIGSIPTMQGLINHIHFPKKYLTRLYTAGYAAYMVFSPFDGIVSMFLLYSAVSYSGYILAGGLMALTIVAVSIIFIQRDHALRQDVVQSMAALNPGAPNKKVYQLLLHIAVLIGLAVLADIRLPFSNRVYGVVVVLMGYSLVWAGLDQTLPQYWATLRRYSPNLLGFKSFLPFLVSTSFLGAAIAYTPLQEKIGSLIGGLYQVPQYFTIQLLILLTTALSLGGVHMLITLSTLALTISPPTIGLSPAAFALTLLTCWYIAMSVSPFVPFSVIVADTIAEKPVIITLKHNLPLALVMLFLAPAVILLINLLG